MFKTTGRSGRRNASGGGSGTARVSSTQMGKVANLDSQVLRRPAFMPTMPQEQGMDSDSSRLGGLEKNLGGGNH